MKKQLRSLLSLGMLVILILACNAPGSSPPPEAPPGQPQPPPTQPPPTEAPIATAIPSATPVPHESVPEELPSERAGHAGDHDSSTTADQKRAPGGDRFTYGRFERPFNADTMDTYYPYLDIQDSQYFQDDTWFYGVITLKDRDENQTLSGRYAVEVDTNQDGGGEWLILVDSPTSKEWSVEGVQVWFDTNDDVGGLTTAFTDDKPFNGNGYETELFNSGQGDDPDLAWARISPQDPKTVHLAIKRSALGANYGFMAGAWAGTSILDPALFDLNDSFTHEEAGAALSDLEYFYPIKAVAELDNVCRVPIDFVPKQAVPGSCFDEPEEKVKETCPPENIFCFNFGAQSLCVCYAP